MHMYVVLTLLWCIRSGLLDYFGTTFQNGRLHKYQMTTKYYELSQNIPTKLSQNIPNCRKIYHMTLKIQNGHIICTNIFYPNLPKFVFLVCKYTYHLATLSTVHPVLRGVFSKSRFFVFCSSQYF
jgi:hypothetical protein